MATDWQAASVHQALQAAIIAKWTGAGLGTAADYIYQFPNYPPNIRGPFNTEFGPPVGYDIQAVGAGALQYFQFGVQPGPNENTGYFSVIQLVMDDGLLPTVGLGAASPMGGAQWRRQRPREAYSQGFTFAPPGNSGSFGNSGAAQNGSGPMVDSNGHLYWLPWVSDGHIGIATAGQYADISGNVLTDGMKAWIVQASTGDSLGMTGGAVTKPNSMLCKFNGTSNRWEYIGQGQGDLPDRLDSDAGTMVVGYLSVGDYIDQYLIDAIYAALALI